MAETSKDNFIQSFMHCANCINDLPKGSSVSDWSHIEVGWTEKGLQVRCIRCDKNILNLDFKGQKMDTI